MATQLLVYESAVPVTHARHGGWSVEVGKDYAFGRNVNSVPLMAVEFPQACAEYPVVFSGTGDSVMPAAVLGLRADQNLYVAEDGSWMATYIPAFLRRYPFVFSSLDSGKTFTLCIDEGFPGFNQEGRGQALFGADAKPTPYVDDVLKFLQQYQVEFKRTQALCRKLKELNLLEPMQAQISLDSGHKMRLRGFSAVGRERVKTLSGEALSALAQADALELIYDHLLSTRQFARMRERAGLEAATSRRRADPGVAEDTRPSTS